MSSQREDLSEIQIFNYRDIPAASRGQLSGANDRRLFQDNDVLGRLLPSPDDLAFAWTRLREGEVLPTRSSDRQVLLVVCDGSAEITGAMRRTVSRDAVVAIPAGCEYGVARVGPQGFHAIAIEFDPTRADRTNGSREQPELDVGADDAPTLEGLLRHSRRRLEQSVRGRFFTILSDGTLDVPEKCSMFFDCIEAFSHTFQTIIFGRQATCRDPAFAPVFLAHFRDELGHDELLADRANRKPVKDAILLATANWFSHQMYVADNVEKAVIVHLVLEEAGHHFHTLAREKLDGGVTAAYHDVHAENDDGHAEMGIALLEGQHTSTYRRLHRVLEEAWDMFDTMTTRIADIASGRS